MLEVVHLNECNSSGVIYATYDGGLVLFDWLRERKMQKSFREILVNFLRELSLRAQL
jgi:hypothetical protein